MSKRHDFSIFYKTKEVKKESPENNTKMLRDQFFLREGLVVAHALKDILHNETYTKTSTETQQSLHCARCYTKKSQARAQMIRIGTLSRVLGRPVSIIKCIWKYILFRRMLASKWKMFDRT